MSYTNRNSKGITGLVMPGGSPVILRHFSVNYDKSALINPLL